MGGMKLLLMLALLSVFTAPGLARAAEPSVSGSHPVAEEPHGSEASEPEPAHSGGTSADAAPASRGQRWYGWQSLSTDGAALLLLIASGASSDQRNSLSEVFGAGAFWAYLLGGPVSHFAHDNIGRGIGSLALRAGLPVAFGAVGFGIEDCSGDNDYDLCGIVGSIVGGVVGIAAAISIDAAVLSYEEVPVTSEGLNDFGVSIGRNHAALVANGTF